MRAPSPTTVSVLLMISQVLQHTEYQLNPREVSFQGLFAAQIFPNRFIPQSTDLFRPDSSTESNNDNSPVRDRRSNTPRHIPSEARTRHRQTPNLRDTQPIEVLRAASNNR